MLKSFSILVALPLLLAPLSSATGQEYSVEVIDGAPEADEVSGELLKLLDEKGVRVKRDSSRTVCEMWFCKQWDLDSQFDATPQRLYPFSPGQLIGLVHFSRKGSEFRDQSVNSGWYTLRFDLQPVDGNHVGTSPTRDFLLLVDAPSDEADKLWGEKELHEASAEVAGSSHPAMFCLQQAVEGTAPALRHDGASDWWILHVVGKGITGEKTQAVSLDLVVVGHAAE